MLLLISLISLILIIFLIFLTILRLTTNFKPKIVRYEEEKFFYSFKTHQKEPFPNLINLQSVQEKFDHTVYLSIIIPAYNEESRLPKMLKETLVYLENRHRNDNNFDYEIIVVDDGSKDRTSDVVLGFSKKYYDKIKLLKLKKNRGKGGAVRLGILSSKGRLILFVDADGATKFEDFEKLEKSLKNDETFVAIGSRAHLEKESISTRSILRTVLMYGFHFIVWFFTVRTIKDTQCGFKLFKRQVAIDLFNFIHIEGWAFDVELIYLLEYFKIKIIEIPVNWTEIEGSKIVPIFSWLAMGFDVLKIFFMYFIGAWKIPNIKLKKN